MLEYYGITIHGARDLQREIPNPTRNYPPGLNDPANAYIQTKLFEELFKDSIDQKRWMRRCTVDL
jgi:hypothetical protein